MVFNLHDDVFEVFKLADIYVIVLDMRNVDNFINIFRK